MDESNVLKSDTENSNSSRISSTGDATSSSAKIINPHAFEEVKCEIEISTVVSLFNKATPPAALT